MDIITLDMLRKRNIDVDNLFIKYVEPGLNPNGPWLAGGAVREIILGNRVDSDYDYFFASQQQLEQFCNEVEAKKTFVKTESQNNITYKSNDKIIQAIKVKFYESVDDLLSSFDFTICQFAYDGACIRYSNMALYDLGRRRLVPNKITYGVSSVRRMIKYAKKGYYACSGSIASMLNQICQDPSVINEKVISID